MKPGSKIWQEMGPAPNITTNIINCYNPSAYNSWASKKKTVLYSFTYDVYNQCIIYKIWYPDPDGIGNFRHISFDDELIINYFDFLYEGICI
jgi:hypothetical protein